MARLVRLRRGEQPETVGTSPDKPVKPARRWWRWVLASKPIIACGAVTITTVRSGARAVINERGA